MVVPGFFGSGMFLFHVLTCLSLSSLSSPFPLTRCVQSGSSIHLYIKKYEGGRVTRAGVRERGSEGGRDRTECHLRSRNNLRCLWKECVKEEKGISGGGLL